VGDIVLVRHASTNWTGRRYCGRSDPPLDADGRATAARLATELGPSVGPGTRIVTSPSRRARETAAAIAGAARITEVTVDDRWREADFGVAEGLTFDALANVDPDLARRLADGETTIDWPGGETAGAVADRVGAAWRDLVARADDIVVVSHAGPLRIAIALATAREPGTVDLPAPGDIVRIPATVLG
jgi:broad specificity phosphatase PhoE